ncbi:MAG TPA: nuclear transport factor 2 family protein [Steroidobacteraceae bacterium]
MFKTLVGSLAVAILALGVAPATRAADADVIREAKDRADIEVLIWRYVQALDNVDVEAYPTFFTEDGSICCEHDHTFKGRAEIKKLLQDVKDSRAATQAKGETVPKMYHPIFNSHIEFRDKDHAHIDSYWFTVMAQKPPNGAPNVALVGRCEDEVVRVNGKWLIKSRNVFP